MSHSGPVKYSIPPAIQGAMDLQGIPTPRQLAMKSRLAPMTVHRLFSTYAHRPLRTYRSMAAALEWDMQKLFDVCLSNSATTAGKIIRARLEALDMSVNELGRKLGWTSGGGIATYLDGQVDYGPMKTYDAICRALGITAGAFCESLLIDEQLDNCHESDTLNSWSSQKSQHT